ncbi:MAG: hypothetical protein C0594_01550, partial [Marinilabiliales bacterium]
IELTTTNNGNCYEESVEVDVYITAAPVTDAGHDMYICKGNNASLDGYIGGATSTGVWSSLGTGTFSPDETTLDALYIPSSADTAAGEVTLLLTATNIGDCNPSADTMILYITDPPFVDAGTDHVVCANNADLQLNGVVSGSTTTGVWLTDGSGSFSPDSTNLNAEYIPSVADADSGYVQMVLMATNACPLTDTVLMQITPAPLVNAGPNQIVCEGTTLVNLDATITGGSSSGQWVSTGDGAFNPSDTSMTAIYTFGQQDTVSNYVQLILTSTNNGNCLAEDDTLLVRITSIPEVDAGPDQIVCANKDVVLNGLVTGGNETGEWSTMGFGIFMPSDTILNTSYSFSVMDTTHGEVILVLTSTEACMDITDTMIVDIISAPFVDAWTDNTVCTNNPEIQLSGYVRNAGGVLWSTLGDGMFNPSDTTLNPGYELGTQELDDGTFTVVITSTENGTCNPETDTLIINTTPSPVVDAGDNQLVCYENLTVPLNGAITGGSANGHWTTNGDGFFAPNDSTLNAVYVPSMNDTAIGTINFILTSTNNGNCLPVSDSISAQWGSSPEVYAGDDIFMCFGLDTISLNAVVSGASPAGYWSTNGLGAFAPGDSVLNPVYNPNTSDHYFQLYFTSTSGCKPVTDTVNVELYPIPEASYSAYTQCDNLNVHFNDASTIQDGNIVQYLWSFGDGDESVELNPAHQYDSISDYPSQLIVVSDKSCIDTMTRLISFKSLNADFVSLGKCLNDSVVFTDSSQVVNDSIESWQWIFAGIDADSIQYPKYLYTQGQDFEALLVVETYGGCIDTVIDTLQLFPNPVASFTVSNQNPEMEEDIELINTSQGGTVWLWDFGDSEGTATTMNASYAYNDLGQYDIVLTVSTDEGCLDTASVLISIAGLRPPVVPTAFSPNGDGHNDILYVRGGPFSEMQFEVYNEWGKSVFISNDQDIGWDGTLKGLKQPVGVYIYVLDVVTFEGLPIRITGDVTLLR